MLRVFFEILLPLVLPTAIYLGWVRFASRRGRGGRIRWSTLPWVWLAAAGAVLLGIMLLVVTVGFGTSERNGRYVPPRWTNGRIDPGHFEPRHPP